MSADRIYPLARPKGHKPPMERWKLEFDDPGQIHAVYIGIQRHDSMPGTLTAFEGATKAIQIWLTDSEERPSSERFSFLEGDDLPESITWVCYWSDLSIYENHIGRFNLKDIYISLGKPPAIGLWTERFTTKASRLETNYSGLDYLPGLARLPGTKTVEHTLTAYWGAARDRIPDSGHDRFNTQPESLTQPPVPAPQGLGEYLSGTNPYDNLVHIRSGQFWENCSEVEAEAYATILQPTLLTGLRYLWSNRSESGAMGLRFLRNARDTPSSSLFPAASAPELKETCAAGFFRNLSNLETWAKRHASHLAIFNGAIRHAREFGEERRFRTWHEVSVLKRGEASFEYLNCVGGTGVIGFLPLGGERI
ncbi:hypothetical protein BDV12DRAFT_188452 [Aspergillus spectabilis]